MCCNRFPDTCNSHIFTDYVQRNDIIYTETRIVMNFLIEEYGDIIILLICFAIAFTFISLCLAKCDSIEASLLEILFYHQ